eukprot:scaffold4329_cov115-Cylindrotheca_fusiformis.AAC.10
MAPTSSTGGNGPEQPKERDLENGTKPPHEEGTESSPDDENPSFREREENTKRHHKHLDRILRNSCIRTEAFLWKEVGGMYPFLDIPSGICFLVGSFFFMLAPLLGLTMDTVDEDVLNWINMVGVILYTAAKFLVELRAIYAMLFKGPTAQVSPSYHGAVIAFFIGGFLFGADLIMAFRDSSSLSIARVSMSSSFFFTLGSIFFLVDAFPEARSDHFKSGPSNAYVIGSTFFLTGSVCFIVGSAVLFSGVDLGDPEKLGNIFNFLGGLQFLLGSAAFLLLGYFEMSEFNKGPNMNLPAVRRRCEMLGIDPSPANNPHFAQDS